MSLLGRLRRLVVPSAPGVDETRKAVEFVKGLVANHPRREYFSVWDAEKALSAREPELALGLLEEAYYECENQGVYRDDDMRNQTRAVIVHAAAAAGVRDILGEGK